MTYEAKALRKTKLFYTRLALAAMEDQEASDLKTKSSMSQAFVTGMGDCLIMIKNQQC